MKRHSFLILTAIVMVMAEAQQPSKAGGIRSVAAQHYRPWTKERMAAATAMDLKPIEKPLSMEKIVRLKDATQETCPGFPEGTTDVPSGDYHIEPYSPAGRVFFSNCDSATDSYSFPGGEDYSCSGSLVEGGNIIVTAAHCVIGSGGENGYCDWVFVPEYYEDDASSAGTWAAQQFHWWTAYSNDGNEGYDYAFVNVESTLSSDAFPTAPQNLSIIINSYPLCVNEDRAVCFLMLGYPVDCYETSCNGEIMLQTSYVGTYKDTNYNPPPTGIYSSQFNGASGGPWVYLPVLNGGNQGENCVNGVAAYHYTLGVVPTNIVYSPYFNSDTVTLFQDAVTWETNHPYGSSNGYNYYYYK